MSKTPSPTVVIQVGGADRSVRFSFSRLAAIEAATGMTATQISSELVGYFQGIEGKKPEQMSDAEKVQISKRLRIALIAGFVAGCLDVTLEDLEDSFELSEIMGAFTKLVGGFITAVGQIGGMEKGGAEGNAPGPQEASIDSTPGPASS